MAELAAEYAAAMGEPWDYYRPSPMQQAFVAVHLYRRSDATGSTLRGYMRVLPAALAAEALAAWRAGSRDPAVRRAFAERVVLGRLASEVLQNMAIAGTRKEQGITAAQAMAALDAPLPLAALLALLKAPAVALGVQLAVLLVWRLGVRPSTAWVTSYRAEQDGGTSLVLRWSDLAVTPSGGIAVYVRREKNGRQLRDRHPVLVQPLPQLVQGACLVRLLARAAAALGRTLQEACASSGCVVPETVTDAHVLAALHAAAAPGVRYGVRSIRRGAATLLAASGSMTHRQLMHYGFWRSDASPGEYVHWGFHTDTPAALLLGGDAPEEAAGLPGAGLSPEGVDAADGGDWLVTIPAPPAAAGALASLEGSHLKLVWDWREAHVPVRARRFVGVALLFRYYAQCGQQGLPARGARVLWVCNTTGALDPAIDDVEDITRAPAVTPRQAVKVHRGVRRLRTLLLQRYLAAASRQDLHYAAGRLLSEPNSSSAGAGDAPK